MFADRLRERRKELGKTVSQCAAFLQKTQPAWTLYETGKRLPKLDELLEICRLLDTTPNDLLGVSPPSSSVAVRGSAVSPGRQPTTNSPTNQLTNQLTNQPPTTKSAPGTLPQCARCEHRKLAEKMRKMLGGG